MADTNDLKERLETIDQELYNNTKRIVLDHLAEMLDSPEYTSICTCNKCLKDIVAYALNRLPAKYIANSRERLETKIMELENMLDIDAHKILKKAIKVISKNPRHNC